MYWVSFLVRCHFCGPLLLAPSLQGVWTEEGWRETRWINTTEMSLAALKKGAVYFKNS